MKKIIFLLLFFSATFLFATDDFDDFINQQIKVEAQLLDFNLSLDKKVDIKEVQVETYQDFFLHYASDKEKYIHKENPYRKQVNKLTLRLNSNKYRGNTNAVMRDEVILRNYAVKQGIRDAFHEILLQTESESKSFFKDKINETIVKYFGKFTPLDIKQYSTSDQDQTSPIIVSLKEALQESEYLKSVANTFSSEIVANSSYIYRTGRLSESKFFSFLKTVNSSSYGEKINPYLDRFNLDMARVLFVLAIIILIFIIQFVLRFIIDRTLKHYKFEEDDIKYIHAHITKMFKYIAALFIIHLIVVVYMGIDITSINISKLFSIVYVILIAVLLYRITNTFAYIKMESIKSSKVLRNEVINLLIKVSNAFIVLIASIAILKIFGVNLTALLSGLGIAGAAVAFAAKDSIANIFGSISILIGDVFEQGDWIETTDVNGTVVEIGLRASTVRTFDNALISIPNFELANKGVKNWSRRSIGRRIKMNLGVTYQSSFDDIRQAIVDIRAMLKDHPGIANESTKYNYFNRKAKLVSMDDFKGVKRTTLVYMDEFADSSINILVYCFSRSVVWSEWLEVKEDVMYKIVDIMEKNNLEFAYPSMTLYQAEEEPENIPDKK